MTQIIPIRAPERVLKDHDTLGIKLIQIKKNLLSFFGYRFSSALGNTNRDIQRRVEMIKNNVLKSIDDTLCSYYPRFEEALRADQILSKRNQTFFLIGQQAEAGQQRTDAITAALMAKRDAEKTAKEKMTKFAFRLTGFIFRCERLHYAFKKRFKVSLFPASSNPVTAYFLTSLEKIKSQMGVNPKKVDQMKTVIERITSGENGFYYYTYHLTCHDARVSTVFYKGYHEYPPDF